MIPWLLLPLLALLLSPNALLAFVSAGDRIALSSGEHFFNFVQEDGTVYSWGHNNGLGIGAGGETNMPTKMKGVINAVAVSAGADYTCILVGKRKRNALLRVQCAGLNSNGQLGRGHFQNNFIMAHVVGLGRQGVVQIASGYSHTCARLRGGGVKCWGWNQEGQLGTGRNLPHRVPEPVPLKGYAKSGVAHVSAGAMHTCILTTRLGGVKCAGLNGVGEYQYEEISSKGEHALFAMQPAIGLETGMVGVACSSFYTCALNAMGDVLCWGSLQYGNESLPDSPISLRYTPRAPIGLQTPVFQLFAAYGTMCAVYKPARNAYCFGNNAHGKFGNNATSSTTIGNVPMPLFQGKTGIRDIAIGSWALCVLDVEGVVQCSGSNDVGQLGNGQQWSGSLVPVDVIKLKDRICIPSAYMIKGKCAQHIRACKKYGVIMRWTGLGCRVNGKRRMDAGCQCDRYCGYQCVSACNANKQCQWDEPHNKCTMRDGSDYIPVLTSCQ